MARATLKIKIDLDGEPATIQEIKESLAQTDRADLAALLESTLRLHIGTVATTAADYEITATITPPSPGRPGRRAGADPLPVVSGDPLYWELYDPNEGKVTQRVKVGGDRWTEVLDSERSFRYESKAGSFTASKEATGKWYARRSVKGRLKKIYLGKSEAVTAKKMWSAAHRLSRLELPTGGKG